MWWMITHNYGMIYAIKEVEFMPRIIPIKDLKNTGEISRMCHEVGEPIYITKNGYGDMVIMSLQVYEQRLFMQDVYGKLVAADAQTTDGQTRDASGSLRAIREKYNV
jgi:PHD/YefM family antitoxin component YafN of YafNO toxin-antitoxin module